MDKAKKMAAVDLWNVVIVDWKAGETRRWRCC
jgi:hypothetical protein